MSKRWVEEGFVFLLCLSFLSLMSGFPAIAAERKGLPIGEMISKGDVRLLSQNVQEKVTSSSFPIFSGSSVATENGAATIRLSNGSQIGVHAKSTFSFDQPDRFTLSKGSIEFYIPSSEVKIQVGNLWLMKSRVQQVRSGSDASFRDDPAFGTISIQPNGAVLINNIQGKLSVINPDNRVLAALGPRESLTISNPSEGKLLVAQAGSEGSTTEERRDFLGLSSWEWAGAGALAIAVGAGIGFAAGGGGGGGGGGVCP